MALGATAFLVLNGATFMTHLFIAYADLALTYYQLAAAGLIYLWLREEAPAGSGPLIACMCGGMAWSKYEGWPLVLITFLAAGLTAALAPAAPAIQKGAEFNPPGAGRLVFFPPLALVCGFAGDGGGEGSYRRFLPPPVLSRASGSLLKALVWIPYFGLLWPTVLLSFILAGTVACPHPLPYF